MPRGLDDLVVACLAKDPDERPTDARALQHALTACQCEPPWSTDVAETWWRAYRTRPSQRESEASEPPAPLPTLLIAISDRVARKSSGFRDVTAGRS